MRDHIKRSQFCDQHLIKNDEYAEELAHMHGKLSPMKIQLADFFVHFNTSNAQFKWFYCAISIILRFCSSDSFFFFAAAAGIGYV